MDYVPFYPLSFGKRECDIVLNILKDCISRGVLMHFTWIMSLSILCTYYYNTVLENFYGGRQKNNVN